MKLFRNKCNKAVDYFVRLLEGEETQIGKLSTKEKLKEILKRIITILKAIFGNEKAKLKIAVENIKHDGHVLQTFLSIEDPTEKQLQDAEKRLSNLSRYVLILQKFELVSGELPQTEIESVRNIIDALHKEGGGTSQSDTGQGDTSQSGNP